ncbi:Rieske (2Fe-2S) protein [Nocardioides rotundus]|uniref:cytochrome bc1 complex Rieske iron-sulfur subunit n=1 Tax=Nocardioides rotundus TaxID=1774216 RepID=UPI001CBFFDAF|nr:Rieske 2Fe-2S domain-containing protein [Nocardioides rotundus]UAL30950.1 Rieske (2Fe-2S) protein [Nocardioides rotundus]
MSTLDHRSESSSELEADPIADPGLPEHQWRPTDVDEKAEKRAERQVTAFFVASMVCAVLFVVSYFTLDIGDNWDTVLGLGASTVALGGFMGLCLLFIGIGVIQWARKLVGDQEIVEMRHPAASPPEDRETSLKALAAGADEAGLGRRPMILYSMLGAIGLFSITPIIMLRDLGPLPFSEEVEEEYGGLEKTVWRKGMRVVRDAVGTPILAAGLQVGDLVNAEPEAMYPTEENGYPEVSGHEVLVMKSKAAVIVVRMEPEDMSEATRNWAVDGVVVYSKVCTHVGCPISLYERTTHNLLCPCHQSTFDLADKGKVVFGPAARALPQLPISIDDEGYLVAQSDFREPVGPSFWERDSQ